LLLHRIGRNKTVAEQDRGDGAVVDLPVLQTGRPRIHDPDRPADHPQASLLESRPAIEARA
jgi:hypothetical protein